MNKLIKDLIKDYQDIKSKKSDYFYWSPKNKTVFYKDIESESDKWSFLHEYGHALLEHQDFNTDFELLQLEISAWEKAKSISKKYKVEIDEDYLQNCLDSYRDWLYLRSTCPSCSNTSLQLDIQTYSCFNCNEVWTVTKSRKKRCYRKKVYSTK